MEKMTSDDLNQAAMQIIMFAGDCRSLQTEALKAMMDDEPMEVVEAKMKEAKAKIVQAHHIQTDTIQSTIEDEELQTTLLFAHAQDTLMTIYSELNMAGHLVAMYKKLSEKLEKLDK